MQDIIIIPLLLYLNPMILLGPPPNQDDLTSTPPPRFFLRSGQHRIEHAEEWLYSKAHAVGASQEREAAFVGGYMLQVG